jgi:hypothetical protein
MNKPTPSELLLSAAIVLITIGVFIYTWSSPESEQPETPPLPTPSAPQPPPLPTIPVGDTEQSQAIATTAESLRQGVRELHTAPTRSALRERQADLRELSRTIQEGGEASVPALRALLQDPRPDVQMRALTILGGIHEPWAVPLLTDAVTAETTPACQSAALTWLSQHRPHSPAQRARLVAQTQQALLTGLKSDHEAVQQAATRALWTIATLRYNRDLKADDRQAHLKELEAQLQTLAEKAKQEPEVAETGTGQPPTGREAF